MERSSSPNSVAPIRKTRGRGRETDRESQPSSRRERDLPSTNQTPDGNRDRDYDVFRDNAERDQYEYIGHFLNSERSSSRGKERARERDRAAPIPSASPEVISNLITSLSVISTADFDGPDPTGTHRSRNPSNPGSPTSGSFGVDYGAFSSATSSPPNRQVSLDDLAASSPVIRTAKPPSGFSPLTAPKSPKSQSNRSDSGGLKTLLSGRGSNSALSISRPSSRGSAVSVAESIGNLSIERGVTTSPSEEPKLRRQRSVDSWGKRTTRSNKGLMYMSSKERLRDKEEKKRASIGAVGSPPTALGSANGGGSSRSDPFLAETAINEEPSADSTLHPESVNLSQETHSPRPIPLRDSSVGKTGPNAKRSSARTSRHSRKESENAIQETDEEYGASRDHRDAIKKKTPVREHEVDPARLSAKVPQRANSASFSRPSPDIYHSQQKTTTRAIKTTILVTPDELDDGAPSPAVAQGRRRDRDSSTEGRSKRRLSRQADPTNGYHSEGGGGMGERIKRSGSKLKRLSGAPSPAGDRTSDNGYSRRNSQGDLPHIAYERPPSADSVDDAVESYLCSPRLSQKIRHPQTGRVISFSEVGDPNGSAVFCCVGMGLTRYITAFYDELALTLKLRLITPDRPGVGDSESYAEGTATPLGWPGQ